MTEQSVQLTATAYRNPAGQFDHWGLSGGTNCTTPASCTVPVAHGNNASITVSISDPSGPNSGPQQITFAADPIFVTPAPKAEIKSTSLAGQGTTSLSFKDHNWDQDTLNVVLKFNNAPAMDPIIQNGGGGPPNMAVSYLPTTIAAFGVDMALALVLGVVITLIARRLFS